MDDPRGRVRPLGCGSWDELPGFGWLESGGQTLSLARTSWLGVIVVLLIACTPSITPGAPPAAGQAKAAIVVQDVQLEAPSAPGDRYRIRAELHHGSTGGQASITFRLRNNAGGQSPELKGAVQLTPGVVLVTVGEIAAPPGDYTPEVEVEFPAR